MVYGLPCCLEVRCMLLHDSAAVRLHGSLYSAAAAPRCGLVHVLWRWGGRDCCGVGVSKKYTFNLNTRKSIVVVGSFTPTVLQKEGKSAINYNNQILKHQLNVSNQR